MSLLTRRRAAAIVGALAVAGSLITPSAAIAAEPLDVLDTPITLDSGHIDAFNLTLKEDDTPRVLLKEDVTGSHVLRTPESVELFVKPEAKMTVPQDYLPGMPSEIYHLPLTQDHNLIWPGWDTNALTPVYGNASTDIVVSDVDGPGNVFLWTQGQFGATTSLMKDGSFNLPGTILQPYAAHTHAAWAFTEVGTYKFTVHAEVTSADKTHTETTDEVTYTFVVSERTSLTPEQPTQEGSTVTIPDQQWMSYVDGSGAVLAAGAHELTADLSVRAEPALGFALQEDATAEWNFAAEEPAPTTLSISGLRGHYHQNTPIVLTAAATPASSGDTFEWELQRIDQDAPGIVDGADSAEFRITAEQALNGAQISAHLVNAAGGRVASADAVTVEVDDHGASPVQQVSVSGAAEHYHPGGVAKLTADVDPSSVLTRYTWEVQSADTQEWNEVAGQNGATASIALPEDEGEVMVRATLTFNDGTPYVASEPIALHIEDHGSHEPVETSLTISGLADSYAVGDAVKLTATQNPETGEDHYHWFIKRVGADDYEVIPGAFSDQLEYIVAEGDSDAQIIARLYNHDHVNLAEAEPVTVNVTDGTTADKPSEAPKSPSETDFEGLPAGGIALSQDNARAGDTLTVTVSDPESAQGSWIAAWLLSDPVLLGDDWQLVSEAGTVSVTVPEDTTAGTHRVAVYDAAGSVIGWQPLEIIANAVVPGDESADGSAEGGISSNADDAASDAAGTAGAPGAGSAAAAEANAQATSNDSVADLATTGGELSALALGGGLLLLGGAASVFIARRRGVTSD